MEIIPVAPYPKYLGFNTGSSPINSRVLFTQKDNVMRNPSIRWVISKIQCL